MNSCARTPRKSKQIIDETLPLKVLKLSELRTRLEQFKAEPLHMAKDGAPANKTLVEMMALVKGEVEDLVYCCGTLEMWIQLNIPKIADQKGMSESVKEEIADMLSNGKNSGYSVLENILKYHIARAKLVQKAAKFPDAEDFRKAIDELDQKQFHAVTTMCLDLRNNYLIMYDTIIKNKERLEKATDATHAYHVT